MENDRSPPSCHTLEYHNHSRLFSIQLDKSVCITDKGCYGANYWFQAMPYV